MRPFAFIAALYATSGSLLAQASPKVSAQVELGVHLLIYANNASLAPYYYLTMEDSVNPLGYLPMYNISPQIPQDPNEQAVQSPNIVESVTPGHLYYINFSCGALNYADFMFNPPPGYTVYVSANGEFVPSKTIATPSYGGGATNPGYEVFFYVMPNDGAKWLAPGYAVAPKLDDVTWAVSVGMLSNGLSAGALRWQSSSVNQTLLNTSSLQYAPPVPTVDPTVYGFGALTPGNILMSKYSDGSVRYIGTPETQIYVLRNSSGYTIQVYAPNVAVTSDPSSDSSAWTFASSDYIEYTISNPVPANNEIQISHLDRNSGDTDVWLLNQTSSTTTTLTQTSSNLREISTTSTAGPGSGQRTETVNVTDGNGNNLALQKQRVYQTFPWGEELIFPTPMAWR
jgi:hypothetical protein